MKLQELEIELDDSLWDSEAIIGIPQLSAYILDLKRGLEETDYMVIKCYEAQLSELQMPYDLQKLLGLRNIWRNKISEIENKISQMEFEITMLG